MTKIPKKFISSVEDQDKYLNTIIDQNQRRLNKAIINLENRILRLLDDLSTNKNGFIKTTQINFKNAQRIHKKVVNIFSADYGPDALIVLEEYKKIAAKIEAMYNALDLKESFGSIDSAVINQLRSASYAQYLVYGQAAESLIAEELYSQVIAGGSRQQLIDTISSILTGRLDKRGKPMTQYVELWANDTIMNFQNSINIAKADQVDIDTFVYYGNIIATTRPFCAERAGKVFTKRQIQSWTYRWQGKSGPALTNRGGWNCRHHWVPIKQEWEPIVEDNLIPKDA